ncbi:hypothetical protein JW978_00510 [Candidatus Dojkabacteria bacterium]|nr:hypothetical protein [Candidatus Dojkabacteria bacterium]
MKGIILFASNTGNVEKFASQLTDKLDGSFEIVNIKTTSPNNIKIREFEKVVIGTYMRRQKADPDIIDFIIRNRDILLEKDVYIFVSALEAGGSYEREIMLSFPDKIRDTFEIYNVGAIFNYDGLRYIEKVMLKNIASRQGKTIEELQTFNEKRLDKFAEIVNTTKPQDNIEKKKED